MTEPSGHVLIIRKRDITLDLLMKRWLSNPHIIYTVKHTDRQYYLNISRFIIQFFYRKK